MKASVLTIFIVIAFSSFSLGQDAQAYFNTSANYYVQNKRDDALRSVQAGIQKYPSDQKLRALADKLKEEKQKEDQKRNQENEEQQKKEQQKKEQQKKEQQEKGQKEQKDQKDQDGEKSEEEKKDQEAKEKKDGQQDQRENKDNKNEKTDKSPQSSEKAQQMKISEEKARMILEAMKNNEIQYLQQNKRKASQPKDPGKPDW